MHIRIAACIPAHSAPAACYAVEQNNKLREILHAGL